MSSSWPSWRGHVAGELEVGVDGVGRPVIGLATASGVDGDLWIAKPTPDLLGSRWVDERIAIRRDGPVAIGPECEAGHRCE